MSVETALDMSGRLGGGAYEAVLLTPTAGALPQPRTVTMDAAAAPVSPEPVAGEPTYEEHQQRVIVVSDAVIAALRAAARETAATLPASQLADVRAVGETAVEAAVQQVTAEHKANALSDLYQRRRTASLAVANLAGCLLDAWGIARDEPEYPVREER